jgi:homogentisate phytyltransferase/homogentisate geranylgeranyltransferase
MRDTPDLEGEHSDVKTLSGRIGVKPANRIALGGLTASYIGLTLAMWPEVSFTGISLLAVSHLVVVGFLWMRSFSIDYTNKKSTYRYYVVVWNFCFLEYLLFSLSCYLD